MRAVIRRDNFSIEFTGRGQTWNELLRPYLGGPEAPPEPDAAPVHAASAAVHATHAVGHAAQAAAARPAGPVHLVPHRADGAAPMSGTNHGPRPGMSAPPAARPPVAAPSQPRTWYPPRENQPPRRFEPHAPAAYSSEESEEPEVVHVEPSADPATLYGRLASLPGRRSERDAVLAAVWFLTKGQREATTDEVERHFEALHVFPDLKVVPHVLKHVHRTKMLESGSNPKTVRLSKKGLAGVRGRLVLAE